MPGPYPATHDLRRQVQALPRQPGIYQWKDSEGNILYVGKANDLRSRATSYLSGGQTAKTEAMLEQAAQIDFIAVRNQKEALILEQTLIKRHKPRYNVCLMDGKQYPYIKLSGDRYPRLQKTHRYLDDGGTYFGPFPDGYGAFHVMQALGEIFPLRRCKTLPKQKCLYYDIGKCIAPCIDACSDEEYDAVVDETKQLLSGRSDAIVRRLRDQVEAAADAGRYEEAARLRDQLHGLEGVLERQLMWQANREDRDVAAIAVRGQTAVVSLVHQREGKIVGQSPFVLAHVDEADAAGALASFLRAHYVDRPVPRYLAVDLPVDDPNAADVADELETDLRAMCDHAVAVEVPRRGDKLRWLEVARTNARLRLEEETLRDAQRRSAVESLGRALGMSDPPRIIEGFDVSHHAGAHTRAAMVRFEDGEPEKSGYRTFGMRDVEDIDDYASLHEAVTRRYRRLRDEGDLMPDLVLIDGGKGQLEAARSALAGLGLTMPLVSLAKREEEVFLPDRLRPLKLPRDHPGLQLLQRVRDEAHRFGITQVRRKAGKGVTAGPLEKIAGIGPKRRRQLVAAFGGLAGLRTASAEDLAKMPGISRPMAEQVVSALQDEPNGE